MGPHAYEVMQAASRLRRFATTAALASTMFVAVSASRAFASDTAEGGPAASTLRAGDAGNRDADPPASPTPVVDAEPVSARGAVSSVAPKADAEATAPTSESDEDRDAAAPDPAGPSWGRVGQPGSYLGSCPGGFASGKDPFLREPCFPTAGQSPPALSVTAPVFDRPSGDKPGDLQFRLRDTYAEAAYARTFLLPALRAGVLATPTVTSVRELVGRRLGSPSAHEVTGVVHNASFGAAVVAQIPASLGDLSVGVYNRSGFLQHDAERPHVVGARLLLHPLVPFNGHADGPPLRLVAAAEESSAGRGAPRARKFTVGASLHANLLAIGGDVTSLDTFANATGRSGGVYGAWLSLRPFAELESFVRYDMLVSEADGVRVDPAYITTAALRWKGVGTAVRPLRNFEIHAVYDRIQASANDSLFGATPSQTRVRFNLSVRL